jgi:hypothetical protein
MDHSPSTPIPFTDLPEGTVTFLFTDIEGSTRLLEQLREGYATLLASLLRGWVHHHRLRTALLKSTFSPSWSGRRGKRFLKWAGCVRVRTHPAHFRIFWVIYVNPDG